MSSLRVVLVVIVTAFACSGPTTSAPPPAAPAAKVLVNVDTDGVGLGGHDPVAYATDNAPVIGIAEQASPYGGATYRFASAEHKATFDGDMKRHAPQFGGYCAYAASQGRLSVSDPTVFQIYEGQLLVFTNPEFKELFNKDPAGNKAKADQNWPGLVAKYGN